MADSCAPFYTKTLFVLPALRCLIHLVIVIGLARRLVVLVLIAGLIFVDNKRNSPLSIASANLVVGIVFFSNACVTAYKKAQLPEIEYESLLYLVPVAALFPNLLILRHGKDSAAEEEAVEENAEQQRGVLGHSFGCITAIGLTALLQLFERTTADVFSCVVIICVLLMCASYLIKESVDILQKHRSMIGSMLTANDKVK